MGILNIDWNLNSANKLFQNHPKINIENDEAWDSETLSDVTISIHNQQ